MRDDDRGRIPWTAIATLLAAIITVGGAYLHGAAIVSTGPNTGTTTQVATSASRGTVGSQDPVVDLKPSFLRREAWQLVISVRVEGRRWYRDDYVTVTFGTGIDKQDAEVNFLGTFSTVLVLPGDLQSGDYTIWVDGLQSKRRTSRTFNLY